MGSELRPVKNVCLSVACQYKIIRYQSMMTGIWSVKDLDFLFAITDVLGVDEPVFFLPISFWWLVGDDQIKDGPAKRFAEEMVWLTANWFNLDKIFKKMK